MAQLLYEVPVIHQDLRHEDTILQIADAFEYLNQVINDVFSHIESKVREKKIRLQDLQQRTHVSRCKVEKLTGSKKATKVVSCAKYPAVESHKDYESIFKSALPLYMIRRNESLKSKYPPVEGKVLQEKLQFYHVKVSNKLLHRNVEIALEEGLGSLPNNLNAITSLFLFNTSENPYKQYVMLDPLGATRKTRQALKEEDEGKKMEAAPLSISQREHVGRPTRENYFYSPGLGDVPQLDVPLDLPDLPGIADDLQFSMDSGPMIAPSVLTTPPTTTKPPTNFEAKPEHASLPKVTPTLPTSAVEAAVSGPTAHSVASSPPCVPSSALVKAPPPPPPPPPPTTTPLTSPDTIEDKTPTKPSKTAPAGDMRATLMEAIRNAGGSGKAHLRSISQRKTEAKKKKQEQKEATSSSGGDLMADLHAKLSLRRKGISGANKVDSVTSAMEKVSAMIPPPPRPDAAALSTNEDESDWEV